MALRVNAEGFDREVLQAHQPVLVEFYSDSCIPCKKMAAVLADLEEEYEDKICVRKVNVNYEDSLVERYRVMSSPTVILFNRGEEAKRLSGAVNKEALEGLFSDLINEK
ncbi:thioredoxin domain-containing protein [Lachnospiraceae bacterium 54-53]